MILNLSSVNARSACKPYKTSRSAKTHPMPSKVEFSISRTSWAPHHNLISCFSKGTKIRGLSSSSSSSASSLILNGEVGGELSHTLPKLTSQQQQQQKRGFSLTPRASKDIIPFSFRYPPLPMIKKPKWWWRILACLPYIMPMHQIWRACGVTGNNNLSPFLKSFELMTHPFLTVIDGLPEWFMMAYFSVLCVGVIKRKEWPYFLRFNVVMGMLFEIALEVIVVVRHLMPRGGKIGMHFWAAVSLGFLFTVLRCICRAVNGMYPDIPFFCDAAYMQTPYTYN